MEPAVVKCPMCSSDQLLVGNVTDTEVAYRCETCGAKFQVTYPVAARLASSARHATRDAQGAVGSDDARFIPSKAGKR